MKRIVSLFLALLLCLGTLGALVPGAGAISAGFFNTHSDWHFDLTKEPNRPMTVEELIALMTSYSWWSTGSQSGTTPLDKNGRAPSEWAAPYIRMEYAKGTIDPSRFAYDEPATYGFFARFLARVKGLYSFDAVNVYDFSGTDGLNAEEKLLLCAAVDYGLIPYSQNMDVSRANLLRKDLESKYLIPTGSVSLKYGPINRAASYRNALVFFEDTYDYEGNADFELKREKKLHELENIRSMGSNINLVNMNIQVLNQNGSEGYFLMNRDRVPRSPVHQQLMDYCRENGIKVLMGVLNYYDATTLKAMKNDPAVIDRVADELVSLVVAHDFYGLQLDIEMFTSEYRAQYSALLRALSTRLHQKGKVLVNTIGAYFNDASEAKSLYDYDVIRETCDLCVVILYDDHSARNYNTNPSGEAGYLSHYEGSRRRLTYAVERLGADKVITTVATYGVDFNLRTHTASNIVRQDIDALLKSTGAAVKSHGSPMDDTYFSYTDGSGNPHEVYYDSDEAIARRLNYATQYGLAGVCAYYALSDTPAVYNRIGSRLVDLPFKDVSRDWAYEAIKWAVEHGVTTGTSATTFSPNSSCTRGQVVTFLWRAIGSPEPTLTENPFRDVKASDYFYKPVLWALEHGVTTGTSATEFSPNDPCTRGQVVTFLWRAAGKPSASEDELPIIPIRSGGFQDVHPSDYFYEAVQWAVAKNITNGTKPGFFSPSDTCTRAQVVTFLYRAESAK